MHHKRPKGRGEEKDNIHDSECKRRLEHRARLVRIHCEWRVGDGGRANGDGVAIGIDSIVAGKAAGTADAVLLGDEAQLVDGSDKSAYEADVDEGDEGGRSPDRITTDTGYEGPDTGEDRDDEEDTGGRRLSVILLFPRKSAGLTG